MRTTGAKVRSSLRPRDERVSARLPSKEEAGLLVLNKGEPVLSVLVVACDVSGQALQVTDVLLLPADRQELEDTYRLG
jgi:GntR family transcriptional regulator